jgi:hypothetical protein
MKVRAEELRISERRSMGYLYLFHINVFLIKEHSRIIIPNPLLHRGKLVEILHDLPLPSATSIVARLNSVVRVK